MPQDIQEPEAAQPKEALVAPVLPIKAAALPMMDAGSCQMHDPPHGHKHRKAGNLLNRIYDRMSVKLSTVLPAAVAPTPILAAALAVASRAVARC